MKKSKSNLEYILIWTGARILRLTMPINSDPTEEDIKEWVFTSLLNELELVYDMQCPIKYSDLNINELIELIKKYKPDSIEIIHTDKEFTIRTRD